MFDIYMLYPKNDYEWVLLSFILLEDEQPQTIEDHFNLFQLDLSVSSKYLDRNLLLAGDNCVKIELFAWSFILFDFKFYRFNSSMKHLRKEHFESLKHTYSVM